MSGGCILYPSDLEGRLDGSADEASVFSSGHDSEDLGSSPESGSLLSGESASASAPHPAHALSLTLKSQVFNRLNHPGTPQILMY